MSGNSLKIDAGLAGAAGAALWWWKQDSDDRDQRLLQVRQDTRDTNTRINDILSSGDWIRLMAPTVRDAVLGVAAATATAQPASAVPPLGSAVARPDLSSGANVPSMAWPPESGVYDSTGRTKEPGELGLAFSVLTYQEPRAWLQGLTQPRLPTAQALSQLFYASAGLSAAITQQNQSPAAWQQTWSNVLSGTAGQTGAGLDLHANPLNPPRAVSAHLLVKSVAPQPAASAGPTTDAAQRWAVSLSAGTIPAGQTLFSVSFSAPYRYRDAGGNVVPLVPLVMTTDPVNFGVAAASPSGFQVVANTGLTAGAATVVPVSVLVMAGVDTVL